MVFPANPDDRPAVPVKPPLVLLGLIALGIMLQWFAPVGGGLFVWGADGLLAGVLLSATGVLIASTAMRAFTQAGATVMPNRPNATLVKAGLYKYSRNPMYVGLILIYAGFAALLGSVWALILLPVFVAYVRYFAIAREEAYLKRRFGEVYVAYMRKIPRWF